MTAAERLMLEAEADAAEAKARRLREGLRQPGEVAAGRKPPRGPRLPKAPTAEEKAKVAGSIDEAAWERFERRHGVKRSA